MTKFLDLQVPFFKPLWRRVFAVAVTLGWATFELANGAPGWALLFGAAGAWCAWQFFLAWDPAKVDALEAAQSAKDKR